MHESNILRDGFETRPTQMQPMWLIMFQAPQEDIDRIFDAVTSVAPLVQGKTDRNGYRAPSGFEYYRPRAGTPTGAEDTPMSMKCGSICRAIQTSCAA